MAFSRPRAIHVLWFAFFLVTAAMPASAHAGDGHRKGHVDLDDDDDDDDEGRDGEDEPVKKVTKTRRNNPAMMWAGIVMTGVGGLGVVTMSITFAVQEVEKNDIMEQYGCENGECPAEAADDLSANDTTRAAVGIAGISGLLILGVGIPLWVVGGRKKKRKGDDAAIPEVRFMGTGVELGWTF